MARRHGRLRTDLDLYRTPRRDVWTGADVRGVDRPKKGDFTVMPCLISPVS